MNADIELVTYCDETLAYALTEDAEAWLSGVTGVAEVIDRYGGSWLIGPSAREAFITAARGAGLTVEDQE